MKSSIEIKKIAENVINIEYKSIQNLIYSINDHFVQAVKLISESNGRLIVAGVGKSANISSKLVATFNSTGQPSVFLHAADAIHGDLGNVQKNDIVICLSKSGNTEEIRLLTSNLKILGNKIISICGNPSSFLVKNSDININAFVSEEACPHDLAPTSSTTAQLVLGDALAICLLEYRGFTKEDFARFHPGGILGKKLSLKVDSVINDRAPLVFEDNVLKDIVIEISENRLGATAVCDDKKNIVGMITDGDLRRCFENNTELSDLKAKEIMTKNPKKINSQSLVYDAFKIMKSHNITQLIVVENGLYKGIIHLHDIIKEGIVQ
ncbi:KpsF/GutQ family sugar-phosphate isomerase [Flavobacteriales bacterium]|nr:KpsF/GutQ family sugar-phosphate isomerase [Flavobacteriales bacterium]